MRDIPLFTTHNGIASLYFKKIPYTKEAFVEIRDSQSCHALLKECIDVCVMAGAESIYATGHVDIERYPLYCAVMHYSVPKQQLSSTNAVALPISIEQKDWWRDIYNRKMLHVPSASVLSDSDLSAMIREESAQCVYSGCSVIGIGVAHDERIHAVASIVPGGGRDTVLALASCLDGDVVSLDVASTNHKAIALYKGLGFEEMGKVIQWHKIY